VYAGYRVERYEGGKILSCAKKYKKMQNFLCEYFCQSQKQIASNFSGDRDRGENEINEMKNILKAV
jgi:hypothetical protein